ncbi:hypothetical protein KM043_016102 [Ampulex compressa]|nr:hypothetical protein KM043_016102 [Ampulex compressa]
MGSACVALRRSGEIKTGELKERQVEEKASGSVGERGQAAGLWTAWERLRGPASSAKMYERKRKAEKKEEPKRRRTRPQTMISQEWGNRKEMVKVERVACRDKIETSRKVRKEDERKDRLFLCVLRRIQEEYD